MKQWVAWGVIVVLATGCMAPTPPHAQRWPKHRQRGDARFDELERKVASLEEDAEVMRQRIAQLEALVQAAANTEPSAKPAPKGPVFAPSPPPAP